MRKIVLVMAFIVLLPLLASAQDSELFDYHSLDLELLITNTFSMASTSSSSYVDYVSAFLSWYPRDDYRQVVEYISTEPEADFDEESGFLFEWNRPSQTNFLVKERSRMNTKNEIPKVAKKVVFPIKELGSDYADYLKPKEIIDINDDIKSLASGLAKGEDDLYSVVFKLALWVEDNVEYDLSTMTADASQKSSWVLNNRKGVCDEITSLFISMCRSLGIPARFVTGVSYSNVNLLNDGWGPHGWAEVYFPGYGWIPFDVTYKELGYLDAAHIKLKTSNDAKEVSINYSARGRDTEIKPGILNASVEVKDKDYKISPLIDMSAEVVTSETGFGSYNLLIVTIENPTDYYLATKIALANVKEMDIDGYPFRPILLKPRQEQKIYWLLRVGSRLDTRFIYTFPLKLTGERGEQAEASFKSKSDGKVYSEKYMRLFIEEEQSEQKPYSDFLYLNCSASKTKLYINESLNITCSLNNLGDRTVRNLGVCLNTDCINTMLSSREYATFRYNRSFDSLGVKTLVFKAESDLVDTSYYLILESQDEPSIELMNLSYPSSISYDEQSQIKFFLKKKSANSPRNVKIKVEHEFFEEHWDVAEFAKDYDFTVMIRGDNMRLKENRFNITVSYEDEEGKAYKLREELDISLNNPTFWQKIMVWMNVLEHKISKWF